MKRILITFAVLFISAVASRATDYDLEQHFLNNPGALKLTEPLSAENVKAIRKNLKEDYIKVESWPASPKKLGACSAVAIDFHNNVVAFHRGDRIWNGDTFDSSTNVFRQQTLGPIKDNTIIVYDRETGNIINKWGKNLFYLPHGLHINGKYYYITDVALHQVFRFVVENSVSDGVADLVLGQAFVPGRSAKLFCKPTSVASLDNGDFFVADGYCNSRIVKFNFAGDKLTEWGRNSFSGNLRSYPVTPPNTFSVPHALTLVPDQKWVCVADRENGRVQCFSWLEGKFAKEFHSPVVGDRLFSVDYANGTFFVVNGPEDRPNVIPVKGYTFDLQSAAVTSQFGDFKDPHDIAVSADGSEIYVADLSETHGHRLHKLVLQRNAKLSSGAGLPGGHRAERTSFVGETALLVGTFTLLFTLLACGALFMIRRHRKQGGEDNEYHSLMVK